MPAQSCPTLCNAWTVAHQAPLSIGFPRQECWSGLPFPSPGDLPTQESNPGLLYWQADSLSLRFQIGKGVCQGCTLSPCLFNLYGEYIMRNTGLEEAQAGIKIAGRISITSDMQMTPPLWQKVKRAKKPLYESERGE